MTRERGIDEVLSGVKFIIDRIERIIDVKVEANAYENPEPDDDRLCASSVTQLDGLLRFYVDEAKAMLEGLMAL